jgi:hypothetical protein
MIAQRQEHEKESAQVKIAYHWRRIKKLKSNTKKPLPKKKGVGKRRETMIKHTAAKLSGQSAFKPTGPPKETKSTVNMIKIQG